MQNRNILSDSAPDFLPIDPEIVVHDDVPQSDDVRPWNIGIALLHFSGKVRNGFADHCQLLDHGASQKAISFKRFEILRLSELRNSVSSGEDIFQIEPLTPHR